MKIPFVLMLAAASSAAVSERAQARGLLAWGGAVPVPAARSSPPRQAPLSPEKLFLVVPPAAVPPPPGAADGAPANGPQAPRAPLSSGGPASVAPPYNFPDRAADPANPHPGNPADPAGPIDPIDPAIPPPGRARIGVTARFAHRLGAAGAAVSPANGVGIGGTLEMGYLQLGRVFEAALGLDFGYDHFATSEQAMVTVDGTVQTFGSTRVISETSFLLVHSAAARFALLRPYVTVGAGLGLGYFDSLATALRPGTARDTHLLGRVSVGADLALTEVWSLAVRADYTAVRGISSYRTADGRTLPLFGDLFDLGAGIAYRF